MSIPFSQYNETDPLVEVIIGRPEGYRRETAYTEIVNESQARGLPDEAGLIPEFRAFRQVLEKAGVRVHQPDYVGKFVYDQLTPRDIAVTIGNRLVLCNMLRSSRRYEVAGIFRLLQERSPEGPDILLPPPGALLEGGDIIVDKGRIWVGISQRSNRAGFQWLRNTFGNEFEVIAVETTALEAGEDVLHLDCTFNPVGMRHALIYEAGIQHIPEALRREYDWITVNRAEQRALATNVLSVGPRRVIARNHPDCTRVNEQLRRAGIQVDTITFNGAPATGGSFRCCSLPLVRTS